MGQLGWPAGAPLYLVATRSLVPCRELPRSPAARRHPTLRQRQTLLRNPVRDSPAPKSQMCVCVCVRQDETSGAEGIRRMRARARKGYSGTFYLPRFSDLPSASEHTTPLCCRQGALPCRA
jgi:hypothetical protein